MVVADGAGSGAAITDVLDLTGGTGNVGLGSGNLGTALTTGTDNVAIGEASLDAVTTGSDNTAIGDNALVVRIPQQIIILRLEVQLY